MFRYRGTGKTPAKTDRQTVKVENTSSFASTGEPVSSPCERRGDEADRGVRERRADVRKRVFGDLEKSHSQGGG